MVVEIGTHVPRACRLGSRALLPCTFSTGTVIAPCRTVERVGVISKCVSLLRAGGNMPTWPSGAVTLRRSCTLRLVATLVLLSKHTVPVFCSPVSFVTSDERQLHHVIADSVRELERPVVDNRLVAEDEVESEYQLVLTALDRECFHDNGLVIDRLELELVDTFDAKRSTL